MPDVPQPDVARAWTRHLHRFASEPGAWMDAGEAGLAADELSALVGGVAALALPDARAALFRDVFVHLHSGDAEALRRAGRAVALTGEIERLHAFLVMVWGLATTNAQDRALFRMRFEQAGFPELGERSAQALADTLPAPAREPGTPRRVAVLAQHLSIFAHAGTRLALEHAVLLRAAGCEVRVFSAQELTNVGIPGWLGCPRQVVLAPPSPATWKPVSASGTFQVSAAPESWPMPGRWRRTAAEIAAFAPDEVLFVGFFSPLLAWAYRHFPVVGLSVHTLPPLGPVDVWLHQYEDSPLPVPWAGVVAPEPFAYAHRLALPAPQALSLANLGLPPGAHLAVSVGYRLSKEIGGDFAAAMLARLAQNPRWVWLLVGDAQAPPGIPAEHPQVRVLPHQEHIDALLAQCHLYVNPPRMGGGFSVMNAMARGLAAVSLPGSDGGDKLGPQAVAAAQYWPRVDALLADDDARAQCGRELAQRFRALYDLRAGGPRLVAALDAARVRYAQRKAA